VNLTEYQAAALRTAAALEPSVRPAVAGLGLAGEAAEVLELFEAGRVPDPDKLIKELGDVMWYTAFAATIVEVDLQGVQWELPPPTEHDHDLAVRLSVVCGGAADYLKKVVGHGHPLERDVLIAKVAAILPLVSVLATRSGSGLGGVCDRNVAKLLERYANGFSTEASLRRPQDT